MCAGLGSGRKNTPPNLPLKRGKNPAHEFGSMLPKARSVPPPITGRSGGGIPSQNLATPVPSRYGQALPSSICLWRHPTPPRHRHKSVKNLCKTGIYLSFTNTRFAARIYPFATKLNGSGPSGRFFRPRPGRLVAPPSGTHQTWWRTKQDSLSRTDSMLFRSCPVPGLKHCDKTSAAPVLSRDNA